MGLILAELLYICPTISETIQVNNLTKGIKQQKLFAVISEVLYGNYPHVRIGLNIFMLTEKEIQILSFPCLGNQSFLFKTETFGLLPEVCTPHKMTAVSYMSQSVNFY